MTAQATEQPPTPDEPTDDLRRYTPEQVSELGWLPFTPRVIRQKCYSRLLQHHGDGGRITFTADDIRAWNEAQTRRPARTARKKSA